MHRKTQKSHCVRHEIRFYFFISAWRVENYQNRFSNWPPYIVIDVAIRALRYLFYYYCVVRFSIKLGKFVFSRFFLGLESWQEQAWSVYVTSSFAVVVHLLATKSAFSPESPVEDEDDRLF